MTRKRPERRGNLSGLLGNVQELTRPSGDAPDALNVPLRQLQPYSAQPRRSFPAEELASLTESIRQKGILQPLLVRPAPSGEGYEIAAGERRYHASLAAGLSEVPVLVRPLSDEQMLEVGLVENLQREGLGQLDEVEGKLRLIALRLGVDPQEARQRLMSNLRNENPEDVAVFQGVFEMTGQESWQSFAKNKLRMLQWPPEVLDAMRTQGLSYSLAAVVAAAPPEDRAALLEQALSGLTLQELRAWQKAQQPTAQSTRLEQDTQNLSRTMGRAKWVRSLDKGQQSELRAWLATMPKWMKSKS